MRSLMKVLREIDRTHKPSLWQIIYLSDFMDPFYKVVQWFRVQYQILERMLYWGWKMRYNYDFDAQFVYVVIALKLERVHKCMKEHSHLEWNSTEKSNLMRKLAEAKILAKKVAKEKYDRHSTLFHETYSCAGRKNNWLEEAMAQHYPKTRPISEEMYRAFFIKAIERDSAEKAADMRRLHYLLEKYTGHWWD